METSCWRESIIKELSRVDFISTNPDFVAILLAEEDLFQWFNTLGKLQIQSQDKTTWEIKYNKSVFPSE